MLLLRSLLIHLTWTKTSQNDDQRLENCRRVKMEEKFYFWFLSGRLAAFISANEPTESGHDDHVDDVVDAR